ncbi:hypothetical protein C8R41DRAFT_925843 [Lentinula lateritia]|uniref:Uncharacterized protein n=1 Tax=Lentinula lateritia TaxID=40482 RepID=A0ABQ8V3M2_9AGAR|nr:hypothetical protein C8R41DRAFT_925843 [Lentinula lateritia]
MASLTGLQSPTFRMRLMCWAAMGATRVLRDSNPMQIILVEDDDSLYLPQELDSPGLREAYLSSGSCSFRTCTRSMRIPALYLIKLLKDTYDPNTELKDAQINHILHYDVEIPGVRHQNVKVTTGYSAIMKQRNIAVWGVSLAPHWPAHLVGAFSTTRESNMPIATPDNETAMPVQQTMERAHGEFYRLLAIPTGTEVYQFCAF